MPDRVLELAVAGAFEPHVLRNVPAASKCSTRRFCSSRRNGPSGAGGDAADLGEATGAGAEAAEEGAVRQEALHAGIAGVADVDRPIRAGGDALRRLELAVAAPWAAHWLNELPFASKRCTRLLTASVT